MIRSPLPVRLAILAWTILLVAVGLRVALAKAGSHSVVPVYVNAASRWVAGEDVYAPAAGLDVFLYSPGFAATFSLLDGLPLKATDLLWRAISVLVLLVSLRRLAIATNLTRSQTGTLFALAAVLAVPCVNNGQPNVMIAALATLGFALAMERRATPSALAFALAAGIKLYPIAALLLAVVAVPRLGIKAIPFVIAAFAMPFLLQSPDYVLFEYGRLVEAIRGEDRTATMLFRVPHDWTILPRLLLGIVVPATVAKIVSILAGLSFAIVVFCSRERIITALTLGSVWMTLFGPSTEIPTYFLLAPAAAWWCAVRPSWQSYLAMTLLIAPIVRGMFPTSEVLACRTTAPCGAAILAIAAISTALSRETVRTILVRQRARGESGFARLNGNAKSQVI